jgi:integral membrane sensor domain MASE1
MDRLILRALPGEYRERYHDELAEMLATTRRPMLDRVDVLVAAVGLRLGRAIGVVLIAATLAAVVCSLGLVYLVAELRNGVVEVPHHWWSTLVAAGSMISVAMLIVVAVAQHRAKAWQHPS